MATLILTTGSNTQREDPFMEAKDDPIPHFRK
jgi:hypothetical protein